VNVAVVAEEVEVRLEGRRRPRNRGRFEVASDLEGDGVANGGNRLHCVLGGVGGAAALTNKGGSILGGRNWALAARTAKSNAKKLGVDVMVMGHVPFALGKADVGRLARTRWLVKLDGWMARPGFAGPAAMMAVDPSAGQIRQLDQHGQNTRMKYLPAAVWRYHAMRAGL
jgi:hypothetical protein